MEECCPTTIMRRHAHRYVPMGDGGIWCELLMVEEQARLYLDPSRLEVLQPGVNALPIAYQGQR